LTGCVEPTESHAAVVGLEQEVIRFGSTIDTFVVGGGLVRFGIETARAPISWNEFKQSGGIMLREACAFELAGRTVGAHPLDWFCSYEPVPRRSWCCVEEISDVFDLVVLRWAKSARLA
jgi:hypothetical protein